LELTASSRPLREIRQRQLYGDEYGKMKFGNCQLLPDSYDQPTSAICAKAAVQLRSL